MGSIETYITVHDQDLVLQCEEEGKYAGLSHTWMFVGNRPVDKTPVEMKGVVCRNYIPNYEHYPSFYDFTGWFVLAHHQLVDTDHVIFIQDDMTVLAPDLAERCASMLDDGPGMISFTAGHRSAGNWMLMLSGFEQMFNAGILSRGVDPAVFPYFDEWPTTQGTAWRTEELYRFFDWFEPLFDLWQDDVWAGHLAERTPWAWMMAHNMPARYLRGVIVHEARDLHGTGALMRGDYQTYSERVATFGV